MVGVFVLFHVVFRVAEFFCYLKYMLEEEFLVQIYLNPCLELFDKRKTLILVKVPKQL